MNKEILISVVIPMYNRAKTIERCLYSVCNQTYKNIEIIVVDDCSNDTSVDLVKNYKDSRIRLIELNKKSGAQEARNKGIQVAEGEFIAFLDSDDFWEPDKLEIQYNILKDNKFDKYLVIHGDCYCFDEVKNKKWKWNLPLTQGNCYLDLLKRPSPMFQAILTSKQALLEIGLLDTNVPSYQEWDTSIRLSKICSFLHIRKPLFTYVLHSGETISKDLKRDITGYSYIVHKFKNEMISHGLYNMHLKELIIKSLDIGYFEKAEEFIRYMNITGVKRYILNQVIKKRLSLNLFTKKVMRVFI